MPKHNKLGRRQQQILDFICSTISERGYPPSIREIGESVGLSSSSTVHSHLRTLERLEVIRRDPSKPRSIEVLGGPGRLSRQELEARVALLEGLVREVSAVWPVVDQFALDSWPQRAREAVPA